MRGIVLLILFFTSLVAAGQVDSLSLKESVAKLDHALMNKDLKILQQVLHDDISFGHSNGWVQNKKEIFNDFESGKLVYSKIESSNIMILVINEQRATVKMNIEAEGTVNGNAFNLKMHVMQVWVKNKMGWQLLARQSAKLN